MLNHHLHYKPWSIIFVLFLLLSMASCSGNIDRSAYPRKVWRELRTLDKEIAKRPQYDQRHLDLIDSLKVYADRHRDDQVTLYTSYYNIANAYFAFNYDSTVVYLQKSVDVAGYIDNKYYKDQANIRLGNLYVTAGRYLEAFEQLYNKVDSLTVSPTLQPDYYISMHYLSQELSHSSQMNELASLVPTKSYYTSKLLDILSEDSPLRKTMEVDSLLDAGDFKRAEQVNLETIDPLSPSSHEFAIRAFYQSVIYDSLGRKDDRILWEILSAESDMKNAVKDYSSLALLSKHLAGIDIKRSYRYVELSMKDGLFYNSRLRPLQLSRFIMQIEDANLKRIDQTRRIALVYAIIISLMAIVLIILIRTTMRHVKELDANHKELKQLNRDIIDADNIKEKYIASFLNMQSANIEKMQDYENEIRKKLQYGQVEDLLKQFKTSTLVQDETDSFYKTFDTTFLALYPNFVQQFNDLMRDDAKVVLEKGELMNTELRVFALVRLGIDDSKQIADLLRYSVRTIYNIKVAARNGAKISGDPSKSSRDDFDNQVRKIGKIE